MHSQAQHAFHELS